MANIMGISRSDKNFASDLKNYSAEKLIEKYGFELNGGAIRATRRTSDNSDLFWCYRSNRRQQQEKVDEIWDILRNRH